MYLMYKFPGQNLLEDGNKYDWCEFQSLDDGYEQGWSATYWEAKASADEAKEDQPLSRDELEKLATLAGIKFDGLTSDKTLQEKVTAWDTAKSNS